MATGFVQNQAWISTISSSDTPWRRSPVAFGDRPDGPRHGVPRLRGCPTAPRFLAFKRAVDLFDIILSHQRPTTSIPPIANYRPAGLWLNPFAA
jgi:hypothetical protein